MSEPGPGGGHLEFESPVEAARACDEPGTLSQPVVHAGVPVEGGGCSACAMEHSCGDPETCEIGWRCMVPVDSDGGSE